MSLARLRELAMPIILDHLDPTGENRKEALELDVNTTSDSLGTTRVYAKNHAITFFLPDNDLSDVFISALRPNECFPNNYRYVQRNDINHESYHKSHNDFETVHTHILKGATKNVEMNERDFNCLIDTIQKSEADLKNFVEKHFTNDAPKELKNYVQICPTDKSNCLLSNNDAEKIKSSYSSYLRQKRRSPKIKADAERIYAEVEKQCIASAQCFTQAFIATFLDKYLQGLLINQGLYYKYSKYSVEILKSLTTAGLGASYLQTALDAIIRNAVGGLLSKLGMNFNVVEKILSEIGTVVAFTKNPLSLLELGVNGSAASLGQSTAYLVIRALPKLSYEKDPEFQLAEQDSHVVEPPDLEDKGNLRQRF